jgi:hypothetical protein
MVLTDLLELGLKVEDAYHGPTESVGVGTALTVIDVDPTLHAVGPHLCRPLLPCRRRPIIAQFLPVLAAQPARIEWLPSLWVIAACLFSDIPSKIGQDVGVPAYCNPVKDFAATFTPAMIIRIIWLPPSILQL